MVREWALRGTTRGAAWSQMPNRVRTRMTLNPWLTARPAVPMGFEPPMTGQRVLGRHKAAPIRALLGALLCAMFPLITQAETLRYKNIDHGLLSQKIDHQGRVAGTFQQRYTIVRDYSHDASQAPVLNFICNTTACDEKSLPWGVALLAREIGATMVLLETRFLGQSQPFGDLSVEKLGLLTTSLQKTTTAQN